MTEENIAEYFFDLMMGMTSPIQPMPMRTDLDIPIQDLFSLMEPA